MDNMNPAPGAGKVIRAPSLKRGKSDETRISDRVKLERVLGLTVSSNAALDCDPETEVVAYPAGCTVVLYNPRKNRQSHLLNSSRKTITCLAFSADGRYLVTGECGHLPSVRVWDLQEGGGIQIAEFPGHKYGINCVAFSPSHKYVVSVGSQHDMIVNVWDWRSNVKVASNKVSAKVKSVSFAENGNYFVTVGNRHVKFWYLEYSRSAKYKEPMPLMGRSAILGEQRNNYFCDVACGRGEMGDSTYAITKSGLLCEFNNRRLLDKWVELRTTSANCMAVGENLIFIGCAEGIVRCFSPSTLQFVTTLPRTHYLGVDVAQGLSISHMATHPNNAKYPDAVALAFDQRNLKLTCVYNDHSLYVWDVRDIKRVGKSHSFLFHSACIWGVEMFPPLEQDPGSTLPMPAGSFITCSSDDTIRVWNLEPNLPPDNDTMYKRNIYSNELLKVLYVDQELTYLKDLELSGAGTAEKSDSSYDGRNGVRSIRISPDGKHLASGDRAGNIRIHELQNLQELCRIEAHDAEVLCLEYSRNESGHRLLASASRDRLIHVFSVEEEYNFLQTLDDHSSSITAVRFLNTHDQLQMVSCGADKSIIFRQLTGTPGGTQCQFSRGHNIAGKTTLYDMEVDSGQKHILTACQDRNIRVYNVNNGKHSKTYKGSVSEDGSLIKVVLDSSGIYSATSCTDKTLCIYDYYSGECMATMFGHSELVTGLRFTNDCRRLVSASGDGCIFVWRVPHDMVVTMHARLAQQAARAGKRFPAQIPNGLHLDNENFGSPPKDFFDPNANSVDQPDYRFSVGQLPLWAKKQIADNASPPQSVVNRQMDLPKGRWAQRLDAGGITVKSVYDSDSIIQIPLGQEKRLDSDGSKDSSIDSGTEVRHYADFRRETVMISKQGGRESTDFVPCPESYQELTNGQPSKQVSSSKVTMTRGNDITELTRNRHLTDDSSIGSYKYEDMESTEHDGDVEDYSEGEGESTEPEQGERVIYYPPAEETGSDYTVNAMDVEELRRSQRRMKKSQRPERLSDIPIISVSASVSGSQESDEDDDEVSTPSAETAERNLLSMLSVSSTESLDRVGQREKYLKNTFESLSGAEQDGIKDAAGTSISSQFQLRASQGGMLTTTLRNVAVINAAKQTRVDNETTRKREELQRRIEETRRKLQSVGYRSNLKSSQSITDLSQIPEKDARNLHGANHLHRYTAAGGKQYTAALMRQQLNSIISSTNPVIIHQRQNIPNSLQTIVTPLAPAKYFAHLSKITFENAISKSPTATFYNTLPTTKAAKLAKNPLNKTELTRLRSLPLPNTMSLLSDSVPKLTTVPCPPLQYTDTPRECTASLTTKTVMYSTYHTLPSTKKTANILKGGAVSNSAAVVMEITGNICSSLVSDSKSVGSEIQTNTSLANLCTGSKTDDASNPVISSDGSIWPQAPTNNALYSSPTSATKALSGVRTNISGNSIRDAQKHGVLSPSKRPIFLNIRSGCGGSGSGNTKYNKGRTKPPLTNQSLPESPVCEDLNSPTGLFHNLTDTETSMKSSRIVQQRRSCSYFIDLNNLADNEQEFCNKNTKCVAKSSESLPATLGHNNLASSEENLLDSCEEEDNNGDFSSDSLEEPSEFSNRTPRRCISDYQIFARPPELVGYEFERRSASAAGRQYKKTREGFHSQESILSNTSGQLSSCNNSGDILEMCANYEQDRHSSASFFLSLRHRNTSACRSQESILTDESEYQMFSQNDAPKYDRDRHRDSCRSTESILESDYHFTSMQQGNLTDYERTRHRDSCQSTESILTDDSDCQLFISCNREDDSKNKVLSINSSEKRNQLKSDLDEKNDSESKQGSINESNVNNHRPIFRTRSLQDTRSSLSVNEQPATSLNNTHQAPSKIILDESNPMLQKGNERPGVSSLVRKNSYPRSRPQTPTSLQMQSQFSMLNKSYTTAFDGMSSSRPLDSKVSRTPINETEPKSCQTFFHPPEKSEQHRHSSNRPPTAPKPIGKVTHKPPLKPRQKPSQQQGKLRPYWNNQGEGVSYSQRPLKGNHSILSTGTNAEMSDQISEQRISKKEDKVGTYSTLQEEKGGARLSFPRSSFSEESPITEGMRTGGVKLLCRSFENAVEDYDISDDCAEEDSFPVLGGSGSSTPATSSSAANSPKRLWPPASRAPNQRQLGKRLGTRHQILPSKCSGPVSGKVTNKGGAAGSRTLPRHGLKTGTSSQSSNVNMTRSTSMGMLNQSDSESDLSLAQRSNVCAISRVNGLMRPTISSQNKVTSLGGSKSASSSQSARRRGLTSSYSSVNLSQVGNSNNNEDSSSEETSPVGGKHGVRPRSTSIDRSHAGAPNSLPLNSLQPQPQPRRPGSSSIHGRYGSERDLSRSSSQRQSTAARQGINKPVPASRQSQLDPSPHELPVKDTDQSTGMYDVASAPLSQQLCSSIADQLTRTADSVVQLYKRLALETDQTDHRDMLRGLEEAANEAQRTLKHVAATGGTSQVSAESLTAASKLQDIVANSGQGEQANVVAMMQQYSDMLLTMVQQRMANPNQQKPS